jgi:hypothetical protein
LRKGNNIVLSDLDCKIINSIMYYLKTRNQATLTQLYKQVKSELKKPTLSNYKIWACILILYIRHKVSINNWKKDYQRQFRTTIKLTQGERL